MELDVLDIKWAKEFLRKMKFFTACTDTEIDTLVAGLEKDYFKAGQTILMKGEISNRLYLIRQGKVTVWIKDKGQKRTLAQLESNNHFGEISLFTPCPATANVVADNDVEVLALSHDALEPVIKANPAFQQSVRKEIEERVRLRDEAAARPMPPKTATPPSQPPS